MKNVIVDNIKILFNDEGKSAVDLFADACTRISPLIYEIWDLKTPSNCKIYIMTSWQSFLFHSASFPRKLFYVLTILLWYVRINREWPRIIGWTLPPHPTSGVKTPALIKLSDRKLGEKIFIQETNLDKIVQSAICHELVHAFSVHLKLPLWLNEGIAMYTVDKFIEKTTVKAETIKFLETYPHKHRPTNYRKLMRLDADSIVYNYVRSYWLTRYLEHNYPGFIKSLLVKHQSNRKIEKQLSVKTGIPLKEFWNEIDKCQRALILAGF